jgi:predicted transcriptional regulator
MISSTTLLSEELKQRVEDFAQEQNRQPSDVMEEAVNRYLASERLGGFAEKMERRARDLGISDEDIPRLIQEVRRENESRGAE